MSDARTRPGSRRPAETGAEPATARKGPLARRAWLAAAAAVGLGAVLAAYLRLSPRDALEGLVVHARPRDLPPLKFSDENGKPTDLAAFRGRAVLLNVWATWCPPCREEMPTLDRLQAVLGGPWFEVVALSIDSGGAPVVQAFFRQIGVQHLHPYLDTSREAMELVAAGIPLTLLIDVDGREVARKVGPAKWDDPRIVELIRGLVPKPAQP